MNRLTDIQEIWNYIEFVYKHPRISWENLRKIAHPEVEISTINQLSVRKWGNEQIEYFIMNSSNSCESTTSQQVLTYVNQIIP